MYVKFGAIWELGQHLQSLLSSFSYQMLIVCLHGVQFFSHTYILLVQLSYLHPASTGKSIACGNM